MKRIEKPQQERIGIIKIFRDDIEKLFASISSICGNTEMSIDEFKIENLNELDQLKGNMVKKMRIEGYDPHFILDLTPDDSMIWISDSENPHLQGLKKVVTDGLKNRPRADKILLWPKIRWIYNLWGLFLGAGGVFLLLNHLGPLRLSGTLADTINLWRIPELLLYSAAVLFVLDVVTFYINTELHCKIYLLYSNNVPTFLRKNKDALLVNAIVAILSFVLAFLFLR